MGSCLLVSQKGNGMLAVTDTIIWRTGKKVTLRPHRQEDLPIYQRWINDQANTRYLTVTWPIHRAGQQAWLDQASANSANDLSLAIWTREDEPRLIGNTALRINPVKQSADTGTLIGLAEEHTKGYATDAKMLLLEYAFQTRAVRKVTSAILSPNGASQRYAVKCGYRHMATIEQEHFRDGTWIDEEQYVVFRDDWLPIWEKYQKDL